MDRKTTVFLVAIIVLSSLIAVTSVDRWAITASTGTKVDYQYEVIDDGSAIEITHCIGPTGSAEGVVVPSMIDGLSVTIIGDDAFEGNPSISSITVPNSVISIGNGSFQCCIGLKSVNLGNNITSIGNDAFEGSPSITSITIPSNGTFIGDSAFEGCIALASVTLGNDVASIGNDSFEFCFALTFLHDGQ